MKFHSKGITHRDIKLENIFLDKNKNIKLADPGLAGEESKLSGLWGTDNYMAPEIHSGNPYTESVDIFAMGVMLFMMRSLFDAKSIAHWSRLHVASVMTCIAPKV